MATRRTRLICLTALAALAALCASLVSAGTALATTETARSGDVSASFSFTGSPPTVTDQRLEIVNAGQVLYNQPVSSPQCGALCGPGALGSHASSVRVLDLEIGGPPDVVLELFTGGANCCFVDQVFSLEPGRMTYVKTERDFVNAGASIKRLVPGGSLLFVSADPVFDYAFTDGADSAEPIQIWSFSARHFSNVTRLYPKQIAADASRWLALFRHHLSNGVGLIAAWAGDEELLGHNKLVQSTLASEARDGDLRTGTNPLPGGSKFVAALNRLLRRYGYLR